MTSTAVRAVDDVSCELYLGEVVGLLGRNGAGKTMLIKMLAGVYPDDGGTIKIRGRTVELASPRDAQLAGIETIYQHLPLTDNLDAAGNLFLGRELPGAALTSSRRPQDRHPQDWIREQSGASLSWPVCRG